MTIQDDYDFLTPPAVARLLGVSHNQIIYWINRGQLPAVDLSKDQGQRPRWRIRRADLEAFLASRAKSISKKKGKK